MIEQGGLNSIKLMLQKQSTYLFSSVKPVGDPFTKGADPGRPGLGVRGEFGLGHREVEVQMKTGIE